MIIKAIEDGVPHPDTLNFFPNQFVTDAEKQDKKFTKSTLDYFQNIAFAQYKRNKETFAQNYKLLKGIIGWKDFYYSDEPIVKDFMDSLQDQQELPAHIKHYPIINRPINTMVGELTKRPDHHRVRAFDDDSKAEELEYKTQMVQDIIIQSARNQVIQQFALRGEDLPSDQLEELTTEKVQDYLTDYTSLAERWGNHIITAMKPELQMKDKGEDAFRDLLTSSREFFHIYENNSKRGFDVKVANVKNVFHSPNNDKKYSRDWYFGGLLEVMEMSEILEEIPDLTKEEIDHLVEQLQNPRLTKNGKSNFDTTATGPDTITYNTYYALEEQERDFLAAELEMSDNDQELSGMFTQVGSTGPLTNKFTVMRVYWISKKLIGELTFINEKGQLETKFVDENYEEGTPGELAINWGWVNQWYQGIKIGTEVYIVKPFKLLDYCPIIGVTHEVKNTPARSLVDLMKPFQSIYNVCLNQLWEILEKEYGNVAVVNLRRVPTTKDEDNQDAVAEFEAEAKERGMLYEDDSPENTRVPTNNTNLTRNIDLNRAKEIESRIRLAEWAKEQAMSLVGMSEQRMGQVQATETATGTQTALSQSFAQTEPYFAQHEYVMDQVYQAILDAAQYIESSKDVSTLSYITSSGESAFMQVTAPDIKFRDLHIFSTSRAEDTQLWSELRSLAQPMLQNGAEVYDIIQLYSTNSIRQMKQIFKQLQDKREEMYNQQQQLEQQKLQQESQQFQLQLQEQARQHQLNMINENIQKEEDRKNRLQIAIVGAMGRAQNISGDANGDGTPDIYQTQDLINQYDAQLKKHEAELVKLNLEKQKLMQEGAFKVKELQQKDKELKLQEKNMQNDKEIALINARNRAKSKTK